MTGERCVSKYIGKKIGGLFFTDPELVLHFFYFTLHNFSRNYSLVILISIFFCFYSSQCLYTGNTS